MIRQLMTDDYDNFISLAEQCYLLHQSKYPDYFVDDFELSIETFQDIISNIALGLIKNGRLVGFALAQIDRENSTLHSQDIYILPEFRGDGLGRELHLETIKKGKDSGCKYWDCTIYGFNDVCYGMVESEKYKVFKKDITFMY